MFYSSDMRRNTRPPRGCNGSQADYCCPLEQSEQFYVMRKANDCVVEMLRLPGSNHTGSIYGAPTIRRAQNQALLD